MKTLHVSLVFVGSAILWISHFSSLVQGTAEESPRDEVNGFTCQGSVVSLSEEGEPNIPIEAIGLGGVNSQGFDCKQSHGFAKTEANGNFDIRGLKSGCDYKIVVKKSEENNLIMRTIPEDMTITVNEADVTGIRLFLLTRSNTMEITGDIITNPEFWPSLRVKLFSKSIGDQLLSTVSVTSGFFTIPTQTLVDNRWYILKLESTLPISSYSYDEPTITFRANSTYSHFQFHFDPLKKSTSDSFQGEQDNVNAGSLFALYSFIILAVVIFKFNSVKPIYDSLVEKARSFIKSDSKSSNSGDSGPLRRKNKSKRT